MKVFFQNGHGLSPGLRDLDQSCDRLRGSAFRPPSVYGGAPDFTAWAGLSGRASISAVKGDPTHDLHQPFLQLATPGALRRRHGPIAGVYESVRVRDLTALSVDVNGQGGIADRRREDRPQFALRDGTSHRVP